jgi:hypothetical protein
MHKQAGSSKFAKVLWLGFVHRLSFWCILRVAQLVFALESLFETALGGGDVLTCSGFRNSSHSRFGWFLIIQHALTVGVQHVRKSIKGSHTPFLGSFLKLQLSLRHGLIVRYLQNKMR